MSHLPPPSTAPPPPGRPGRVLGIDASRNRSGGARAHLLGLLEGADPRDHGIGHVHLWAHRALAEAAPRRSWLTVHAPDVLEGPLPPQLWWQWRVLPSLAADLGVELMFNSDAGSVCPFRPSVTLSQDLLSYEPGEMGRYGWGKDRARLLLLRWVQNRSFRRSRGVIFLTRYAAECVQRSSGPLPRTGVIPHGINAAFRREPPPPRLEGADPSLFRIVYVSEAHPYKHPWHVVRAVALLRDAGHPVHLTLVGGGWGRGLRRLDEQIRADDPEGRLVTRLGFVPHDRLPPILHAADLFVFASSCENLPITLLEGMAAGLPIACSRRGPMPEVLGDAGLYFDPEDPASIARTLERLIRDPELRARLASDAHRASLAYSWTAMSRDTWTFLADALGGRA